MLITAIGTNNARLCLEKSDWEQLRFYCYRRKVDENGFS